MTATEILTLAPLGVLVVVFGLFPGILLELFQGSVDVALEAAGHGTAIVVEPVFVAAGLGLLAAIIAARVLALRPRPPRDGDNEGSSALTVESAAS